MAATLEHSTRRSPDASAILPDVAVIIPALNEESSLPLVLRDLPGVGRVIVADNGSTDRTARLAADAGADVVFEPRRGYGSACLAGLARLEQIRREEYWTPRVVAFIDADFSDYPEQLSRLLEPILDGAADLVIGSRVLGDRQRGAMPAHSLWGTCAGCWFIQRRFGIPCTDLGPFRAIRYEALQSLGMSDTNFGWTVEMQIKAARAGLRVLEVPVSYRRRIGQSKISGTIWGSLRASYKILSVIGSYAFRR